jgi:PTH1 family peptidyl-tRNA hydrolase
VIKLIVGLGNPGQEYEKTRHNAGFLFLDLMAATEGGIWLNESRFNGQTSVVTVHNRVVRLIKPMLYMNRSGQAVGNIARYYKIETSEILVVHDELDFSAGTVKLKKSGGHGGHNGLKDIIAHLGGNEFYRLRIGVGRPSASHLVSNYVLSAPNKSDELAIHKACESTLSSVDALVVGEIEKAMNKINAII